ncbi:MAG: substrate-binding domain-containing protein [Phycisphaerae bacterium]
MHENRGRILTILGVALGIIVVGFLLRPRGGDPKKTLRVFAADSLAQSLPRIKRAFEKEHPDIHLEIEFQGSVVLLRLVPLRRCDVAIVADARLVERMLRPHTATWVAKFATTEMVIAYTDASKYAAQITPDNWYDVLLRKDVHYSHGDPTQDPCGYFALLCWKLAERHYAAETGNRRLYDELKSGCDPRHVRADALELVSVLESKTAYDYAFVYRCLAVDHRLPCVRLPRAINLGDVGSESQYAQVQTEVPSYRGGVETVSGSCITFGATIPENCGNREAAEEFVRFVLSEKARAILNDSAITPLDPPTVPSWGRVPPFLVGLAVAEGVPIRASQGAPAGP